MLRLGRALLLVLACLLVLVAFVVTAYFGGRAQCPPPDWWVTVFAADGWACVA